ncbi:putative ribonuclease H-like domain-containing protein [Tanacetum coccineum]
MDNSRKSKKRSKRKYYDTFLLFLLRKHYCCSKRDKCKQTILLQSLPEDHMAIFHHLVEARDMDPEIDVRVAQVMIHRAYLAPTHSAFISAASTNSKIVLHSFVAESDPQQQITYEDFDQIGKLDLEELDIKWQMAMLSVRINRFEKKAGRKMKFNNRDAARFDKKKVKCYKCSELGHFARECTGKQLDSKARYSAFKLKELDKSEEPKALLSVDSMLNWSDHEGEDEEKGVAQVYGMIAGDDDDTAGDTSGDVSDAAAEFALMGFSSQVKLEKLNDQVKLEEFKARFDKYKRVFKNWTMITSSMSSRSKILVEDLGFGETFGSDEVFDPSAPSIFDTTPEDVEGKPLYDRFVKAVGMHDVPSPITGTFMPPSNKPDLDDTQIRDHWLCHPGFKCQVSQAHKDYEHLPLTLRAFVPCCGSRNPPASVSAGSAFPVVVGIGQASVSASLAVITNCTWMREDGELLLRPQQVVLGKLKGQICSGDPRTMDNPHKNKDLGIIDSGCSRSMTGNKEKLDDFVKIIGGTVTFGGGDGKITRKGTIRTSKLNFENVYYVEELQNFNLFSVSQICDKKNKVLFTDTECLVLTKEFQLPKNSQVVLRVPRRHNLYSFNLTEIQPERDINCLLAKASS